MLFSVKHLIVCKFNIYKIFTRCAGKQLFKHRKHRLGFILRKGCQRKSEFRDYFAAVVYKAAVNARNVGFLRVKAPSDFGNFFFVQLSASFQNNRSVNYIKHTARFQDKKEKLSP